MWWKNSGINLKYFYNVKFWIVTVTGMQICNTTALALHWHRKQDVCLHSLSSGMYEWMKNKAKKKGGDILQNYSG